LKLDGANSLSWTLGANAADAQAKGQVSVTRGDIGPSAIDKILIGLLVPPIVNTAPQDIGQSRPPSVDTGCKMHLTDNEGLVASKSGFDAGDRPGGGCLMLDGVTDVRVGQSEYASHKHLEAMGALASLEQD